MRAPLVIRFYNYTDGVDTFSNTICSSTVQFGFCFQIFMYANRTWNVNGSKYFAEYDFIILKFIVPW